MTNPYARPYERPEDADLTIPLVPDSGYSQPSQPPFTEETLVDPLPQAPRDPSGVASAQEFGYNPTPGQAPTGSSPQPAQTQPNYTQPQVGQQSSYQPYPASDYPPMAAYPTTAQPTQPSAVAPWSASAPVPYAFSEAALPEHPSATTALVLGILGIVGLWPLGPIAWIVGAKAKREMRAEPGRWRSSGSLTTGVVLGVITTVLMVLMTLAILFFVFLVAVASR